MNHQRSVRFSSPKVTNIEQLYSNLEKVQRTEMGLI